MGGFIFLSGNALFLLVSSIFDIKYKKIPNKCTLCMLAYFFAFQAAGILCFALSYDSMDAFAHISGALIPLLIILPVEAITKKSFGAGDKKLIIVLGLVLGVERIIYFLFVMLSGALIYCLIKKIKRGEYIAMAPFMLASYLIISLYYYFHG